MSGGAQTGPRGGRYIVTASGKRLYLRGGEIPSSPVNVAQNKDKILEHVLFSKKALFRKAESIPKGQAQPQVVASKGRNLVKEFLAQRGPTKKVLANSSSEIEYKVPKGFDAGKAFSAGNYREEHVPIHGLQPSQLSIALGNLGQIRSGLLSGDKIPAIHVLVDQRGKRVLMDGHRRVEVAKELGITHLPARVHYVKG